MDPQLVRSNAFAGASSFSIGPSDFGPASGNTWDMTVPVTFSVRLDPQIETAGRIAENEARADSLRRHLRREVMRELTSEFAARNDELLRELAS